MKSQLLSIIQAHRFPRKLRAVTKTIFQAVVLLVCAVSVVGQTNHPSQGQSSSLSVNVSDELGAVIERAFVLLRSDALERENPKPFSLELRTNSNGHAKAFIPSGFYDVFVASTGFAPQCRKLRVRDGKPVTIKFVLKVDKLGLDEYGDRF